MMFAMTSKSNTAPRESSEVTVVTDGVAQVFSWEGGAHIKVRNLGGEVVIEANAAGLRTLAGHLLALAKAGVPDGSHLHLEDSNGLADGSVGLVLERRNKVGSAAAEGSDGAGNSGQQRSDVVDARPGPRPCSAWSGLRSATNRR
jgi:hypothetical protein